MNQTSSKLLIEEEPLQVLPSLAVKLGLNCAMFLQQVHYWLKHSKHEHDGRKWIYNTYEAWHEQFPFWSAEVIRKRIVKPLEDTGVLLTTGDYNTMPMDKTKWYAIDYERLDEMMADEERPDDTAKRPDEPDKMTTRAGQNTHTRTGQNTHTNNQRIQETTTENTVVDKSTTGEASPRAVSAGQFYNKRLAEILAEKRAAGKTIHSPTEREKRDFGGMAKTAFHKDGHTWEEIDRAIEFQVAKAAGEIEGEPAAWCGFRTALDRVTVEGWRPGQTQHQQTADRAYAHFDDYTGMSQEERRREVRRIREAVE